MRLTEAEIRGLARAYLEAVEASRRWSEFVQAMGRERLQEEIERLKAPSAGRIVPLSIGPRCPCRRCWRPDAR